MYWKTIGEGDLCEIQKQFNQTKYTVSDYNVTHLTLWKDSFQMSYTWFGGFLLISGVDLLTRTPFIYMPIGKGDIAAALKAYILQSEEEQILVKAITPDMYEALIHKKTLKVRFHSERGEWEYNYLTKSLASYEGQSLKRKREMCQSFEKKYPFEFEEYHQGNRIEVELFLNKWYEEFKDHTLMVKAEQWGIKKVLNCYEQLACKGYITRVNGTIVGFILAEPLNEEILVVHYEKGNRDYKGVYDIMKRELCRKYMNEYPYVSLEEDMGIMGLRHAKKLYGPHRMIEKGLVICSIDERG